MKTIAIIALGLSLTACAAGLSQFTHDDAVAAQASAELRGDPSAECWGQIATMTGLPETEIIGILTGIQKARNVRRFVEDETLRRKCALVALDILMAVRRLPFIP